MRHLHAGHGDGGRGSTRTKSQSERSRYSQRTGGKSLSLHRVYEDIRIRSSCVSEIVTDPMRAYLPDYQLVTPAALKEALALLAREPGVWKPFAGGTDLMVLLE